VSVYSKLLGLIGDTSGDAQVLWLLGFFLAIFGIATALEHLLRRH
jgi:hypothetical protein